MKRIVALFAAVLLLTAVHAQHLGVPFFKNFAPSEYNGNNRNADIVIDDEGDVFVANFEGLLYYDQATWDIVHLTNLTRPTALLRDSEGVLWVGGYNYFGQAMIRDDGDLALVSLDQSSTLQGEVVRIWEEKGSVVFLMSNDSVYSIRDNRMEFLRKNSYHERIDSLYKKDIDVAVNQVLPIDNGLTVVATSGKGLFIYDEKGHMICNVTEQNGLCSNNINRLAYNGKGMLWGATENGIFSMSIPSGYTRFTQTEGVHGEVYSMRKFAGKMWVGTTSGLYCQDGPVFRHVEVVNRLCWAIEEMNNQLLVASEEGLFAISAAGSIRQLTTKPTRSILVNNDLFYTGEDDGVYLNSMTGTRYIICNQSNVTRILKDKDEVMWLQTLYGEIWTRSKNQPTFTKYTRDIGKGENQSLLNATLVNMGGQVIVVDALDKEPFRYPQYSFTDKDGLTWLTDHENTNLYALKNGERYDVYDDLLYPIRNTYIRSMWVEGTQLWLGGENGITVIDRSNKRSTKEPDPKLLICSVTINGDSVVWGGFGEKPEELSLTYSENNLMFTYALDYTMVYSEALYQYCIDENEWSPLTTNTSAVFNNQASGTHVFQVRAIDGKGHITEPVSITFSISVPFYMKWYMLLLYVVLLVVCVLLLMRWRTLRLEKEKLLLEKVVNERTAEVVSQRDEIVKQKDEIEEKSKSLESALSELSQAQNELIRQEKMATVGKLTQGLIDRILNPLNYINNFSKLSQGLVNDVKTNIEGEKGNIGTENYEDTMDVLGMLTLNLEKVSEHGVNTTRTLKAMEEMLKDRSGGIIPMVLNDVLHEDEKMVKTYYAKEITEGAIKLTFDIPSTAININGNAELLSKSFMSILANSIFAVTKKGQREKFTPEVAVHVSINDDTVVLVFYDNGIGIEDTIMEKIFDPFFTTKPTSEAAGVGLYLSREIIQNHQGDISVKSVKNEYTECTIILPLSK